MAARSRWAVGLVLVFGAVFGPALVSRGPWPPDEGRYAEVARELDAGGLLLPRLNGEVYAEKPPLAFWIAAAVQRATGCSWIVAARSASALGVAVAAVATALLATHVAGARAGPLAALVLVTSAAVMDHGQRAAIDPVLLGATAAAACALVKASEATGRRRAAATAIAALAMSAAVLAKGPVGVLLATLGAACLGIARRGRAGVPWRELALAVAVAAGAGLAWLVVAARAAGPEGDAYLRRMLVDQTAGRLARSFAHRHGPLYYGPVLAWGLLPWLVFVPAAIAEAIRGRGDRPALLGAAAWAAIGLAIFAAVSGKRPGYLLPLYPAFAILVAARLAGATPGRDGLAARVALAGTALFFLALPVVLPRALPLLDVRHLDGESLIAALPERAPLVFAGCGATMAALAAWSRRDAEALPWALGSGSMLVSVAFHLALVPALDAQRSTSAIGEDVLRLVPPEDRVVLSPDEFDGEVNLATGVARYEVVPDADRLARTAGAPGRLWVVTNERYLAGEGAALRDRFTVASSRRVGRDRMHLLVERAPRGREEMRCPR